MIKELLEKGSRDKYTDNINTIINNTINNFIDIDYLYKVFPILSKKELTKDSIFFKDNKISLNTNLDLSQKELKTISYLSLFYKQKIKYNPKEIIRYLKFLGYDANIDDVNIMVFDKSNYSIEDDYDNDFENKYITMEEYLNLSYTIICKTSLNIKTLKYTPKVNISINTYNFDLIKLSSNINNIKQLNTNIEVNRIYADGFDFGFDKIGMI